MKRGIPNYSSQEKISASNNYEQIEKNKQTKKTKQNKTNKRHTRKSSA